MLAVPFDALAKILPTESAEEEKKKLERFEFSPITGIHLWFDRKITDLDTRYCSTARSNGCSKNLNFRKAAKMGRR